MVLGMSSAAFYARMNTEDAAGHLRQFTVDTCEVFLETFSEYNQSFGKTVREHLGALECISVHPKGTQFESDLFASYARQREDALHIFEGVCAAGEALGASFYVLHGPPGFKSRLRPEKIRNLPVVFPEMQKVAADHGMEILWENVSWCACNEPEDVGTLLDMFPDQRFVLDIKQALHAGVDPFLMAEVMGERLAHVHVLDWDAEGNLLLPGEGVFSFERLFAWLHKINYQGAVILEPYNHLTVDEKRLEQSLMYLRNMIAHPQWT